MYKQLFVLSVLVGLGAATSAQAINIVSPGTTFNVTGTFTDSATLGGTININTTTGTVVSGDLTVSGVAPAFIYLTGQGTGTNSDYYADFGNGVRATVVTPGSTASLGAILDIYFDASSLVNYTGGALCNTSGNCGTDVTFYQTNLDPNLIGGAVTLASGVPEPATWMLMLAAPALMALRRFRKI